MTYRQAKHAGTLEGWTIRARGDFYTFKLRAPDTEGRFALFEARNLPQGGVPPHIDHREDEAFYVLDGRYQFQIGDQVRICEAGEFAFVPMGIPHAFTNVGTQLARMLVVVSPAGILEAYFAEIGEPIADLAHPPAPAVTPPDMGRILAAAQKYGIEMLPPA